MIVPEDFRHENHLFGLPDDFEAFLACIAVLQSYVDEVRKRKIEPHVHITWVGGFCPTWVHEVQFKWLRQVLDCEVELVNPTAEFELIHQLDPAHAMKTCAKVEKHISQALGLLLGADPKSLPDLNMLWADKEPLWGLLITDGERLAKLAEYCVKNAPHMPVSVFKEGIPLEHRLNAAMCAEIVVGYRSAETYAAAAAGKFVVELYPAEEYPKFWLSKWAAKEYRMIYGKQEQLTSEVAWKALEQVLRKKEELEKKLQWQLNHRPTIGGTLTQMAQ